jgi:pSer/pThr/pTyr-binding forkhead associated (FHA) protein
LGGRVFAIDLESRNGFVLDRRRGVSGWLDPGQQLAVGPFRVERVPPAGSASLPPADQADDPLENRLEAGQALLASFDISLGDNHVARWRMNRQIALVGQSRRWRVHLGDPSVSRTHCSLVATPTGIWVVDLQSREGTRLNGEPVEVARLEDGDTLEIGKYCMRVEYLRAPGPALHRSPGVPP